MQRLLEQNGLAEEDLYNSFSAYSQGKIPDFGMGFVLEVPESYLKEKAGMAYKDYDNGVFMIGIPQGSFRKKVGAFYEGYGDMEEQWYSGGMDRMGGLGDLSIHFFK